MPLLLLFYRLMVRPLFREPVRTLLTILAIALGVGVVLAIDLAGGAAAGSFRTSMETLAGDNELEVATSGGVPESIVGILSTLPYSIRVSPRIEDYAVIADTKKSLPLIGLDLVAEGSAYAQIESQNTGAPPTQSTSENVFEHLGDADSIWVGSSVGYKIGDRVELLINDQVHNYTVRGVYPDSNGNESAIVMDLAVAQHALARYGRVDRILLKVPKSPSLEDWQQRFSLFTTRSPSRSFGAARRLESCAPSAPAEVSFSPHSSAKPPSSGSPALSLGSPSVALWQLARFG